MPGVLKSRIFQIHPNLWRLDQAAKRMTYVRILKACIFLCADLVHGLHSTPRCSAQGNLGS